MKREIAERWIKALESGDYIQGRSRLAGRNDNSFCCLGVLCELAIADGVTTKRYTQYSITYGPKGNGAAVMLPADVQAWAELHSDNGKLPEGSLVFYNDEGTSFNEIAEIIREHIEVL